MLIYLEFIVILMKKHLLLKNSEFSKHQLFIDLNKIIINIEKCSIMPWGFNI